MEAIDTVQPDLDLEFRDELPEITNRTLADFGLRRLADCEAEEASIEEQYAAAVARLRKRADALVIRARRGQNYFRFLLEGWAEQNRAALLKGKAKSVSMLHGRIGWRAKGGGLKVVDRDALAAWLETPLGRPFARVKYEPDMKALQVNFAAVGEIPPGMETVPAMDEFYATAEAPETALAKE